MIGTEVPLPLLQAIAELPEEVLPAWPGTSRRRSFWEDRLFPEQEYTWHAPHHEVAYGSLLQERRRVLTPVSWRPSTLAGEQVAEQVERLAHHLRGEVG